MMQQFFIRFSFTSDRPFFSDIGRKHFFDRAFTVINSYFDCDFARLDFGTLVHGFQTFGNKTNKFIKCYVNKTGQKIQKKLAAQICGVQLQDSCQRSKFRTIKTIRIPMMHVETLLQRYPNLKVIHLVRDPRAQVNSIGTYRSVHIDGLLSMQVPWSNDLRLRPLKNFEHRDSECRL